MDIAICDDEKIFREQIISYLLKYNNKFNIFEYYNGYDLLESEKIFDIIFLDIEMDNINGMIVAEKLRERGVSSIIIFLTSHHEYVHDAFKVKAFRFLNKPIDKVKLVESILDAETEILNTEKIIISRKGIINKINITDIVYIEAFGDGTYIYDKFKNVCESNVQLKEWYERLKLKNFFKIHKSFIVSMLYVKKILDCRLEIEYYDIPLPIARRNITNFKENYLIFVKSNAKIIWGR